MRESERTKETVRTSDIYQGAYLLSIGGSVQGLEVVKELDKDVCIITFHGESIQSKLKDYASNQAIVDPLLYQKAINRIKDIVFKALHKARENGNKGGAL
jgi:hypothetical protein